MCEKSNETLSTTAGLEAICKDLSKLIDAYNVRLAKIEQAANRIELWNQSKAYKTAAAVVTKSFIKDLRKLKKRCLFQISIEE